MARSKKIHIEHPEIICEYENIVGKIWAYLFSFPYVILKTRCLIHRVNMTWRSKVVYSFWLIIIPKITIKKSEGD